MNIREMTIADYDRVYEIWDSKDRYIEIPFIGLVRPFMSKLW